MNISDREGASQLGFSGFASRVDRCQSSTQHRTDAWRRVGVNTGLGRTESCVSASRTSAFISKRVHLLPSPFQPKQLRALETMSQTAEFVAMAPMIQRVRLLTAPAKTGEDLREPATMP